MFDGPGIAKWVLPWDKLTLEIFFILISDPIVITYKSVLGERLPIFLPRDNLPKIV